MRMGNFEAASANATKRNLPSLQTHEACRVLIASPNGEFVFVKSAS